MLKIAATAGILITVLLSPAGAAMSGPQGRETMTEAVDGASPVAWVCGPRRCSWRPGWRGFVPAFAVWGPPRVVGCVYELRRRGWIEVCP
jgi:hypothetical protein